MHTCDIEGQTDLLFAQPLVLDVLRVQVGKSVF